LMDRGSATVDGPADEILVVDLQLVQLVRPHDVSGAHCSGETGRVRLDSRLDPSGKGLQPSLNPHGIRRVASVSSHLQSRHTAVASSCSCPAR
jgi:hypothetical protein